MSKDIKYQISGSNKDNDLKISLFFESKFHIRYLVTN